jgi:hypothetical protein
MKDLVLRFHLDPCNSQLHVADKCYHANNIPSLRSDNDEVPRSYLFLVYEEE